MRVCITFCCALLLSTTCLFSQVPTPMREGSTTVSGASWNKTGSNYDLLDANGRHLSNVKDLLYLETETLAVLDKSGRKIYLLINFKNAAAGSSGKAIVLGKNIDKNFFITNQNSFANYINDANKTGPFCNIEGSYIYYVEEEDATFLLRDIRKFNDWGAKSSQKLDYSPTNTYWYRDTENAEFGVIEKGKTLDYDRVTSERDGNDLIVKWDDVKTYVLEGYYTMASFIYNPIKKYGGSSTVTTGETGKVGCVQGNCQDGWGKFEDGAGYYDGFWRNGTKNGYGLYEWNEGGKYIGNWLDDNMNGYGVYIALNEDNIIGKFRDGQLNGMGITVTGDDWEQGIFSGGSQVTKYDFYTNNVETGCTAGDCQDKYGRFKWENGDSYSGFFQGGSLYMGTYTFADGGKYSGMFNRDNQFHGMGRYFFADDAYYGGEWNNGKYEGRGYYHDKDLVQQIGEWAKGTLIRNLK